MRVQLERQDRDLGGLPASPEPHRKFGKNVPAEDPEPKNGAMQPSSAMGIDVPMINVRRHERRKRNTTK